MKNTILVVDDTPLYQDILATIVKKLGYKAKTLGDGGDAIKYLNKNRDSVLMVLLDIYMPQIDGISALGHFRSNFPDLPIVMITGSDDASDEKSSRGLGAVGYIKKPFHPETIKQVIDEFAVKAGDVESAHQATASN
jgi:CheY-like chemotaxis protein